MENIHGMESIDENYYSKGMPSFTHPKTHKKYDRLRTRQMKDFNSHLVSLIVVSFQYCSKGEYNETF